MRARSSIDDVLVGGNDSDQIALSSSAEPPAKRSRIESGDDADAAALDPLHGAKGAVASGHTAVSLFPSAALIVSTTRPQLPEGGSAAAPLNTVAPNYFQGGGGDGNNSDDSPHSPVQKSSSAAAAGSGDEDSASSTTSTSSAGGLPVEAVATAAAAAVASARSPAALSDGVDERGGEVLDGTVPPGDKAAAAAVPARAVNSVAASSTTGGVVKLGGFLAKRGKVRCYLCLFLFVCL